MKEDLKEDELPHEVRTNILTEIISLLYVTIILIALFLQILFG